MKILFVTQHYLDGKGGGLLHQKHISMRSQKTQPK